MPQPIARESCRGRILVVDDDEGMVVMLQHLLERNFDLSATSRAKQALDWIEHGNRFDVILSDLLMPELTGMDLHERLLAVAPDQAKRMIFLTGGSLNRKVQEFLLAIANARLEKPFELKQLLVLINARLLGNSH